MVDSKSTFRDTRKDIFLAAGCFAASTAITWWFIAVGRNLYFSQDKMLLSCAIAGAKWGIQLLAALLWLPGKKWVFIRRIGFVCFIGSCVLLPYCLAANMQLSERGFVLSLVLAVAVMIALYYRAVWRTAISRKWFWGWIACLATAISLQVFVVFGLV